MKKCLQNDAKMQKNQRSTSQTSGARRASNDTPSGTWYFGGALGALAAAKESKLVTTGREQEFEKMMSKYQKVNDLQVKR